MAEIISDKQHLNEVIEILFSYISWLEKYDAATSEIELSAIQGEFPASIESLLVQSKEESENYFTKILDQPIYLSSDYLKLRSFLIYWYAAYKTLNAEERYKSDIDIIDKDLLLKSLGYTLFNLHTEANKKVLCTTISDLYSIKGSPLVIQQAFTLLGLNNFQVFEYWLYESVDGTELYLYPESVQDTNFITGFDSQGLLIKPLDDVINLDPHWYYSSSEIKSINSTEPLGLPSLTPYVGVASANDWIYQSKLIMSRTSRIINDQYQTLINDGIEPPKIYYFTPTDSNLSVMELILGISYTYNKLYGRTTQSSRDGSTEFIQQFQGDENILYDDIRFIDEFNNAYNIPSTKAEREQMLADQKVSWQTLTEDIGWNYTDLETILTTININIKTKADEYISANSGETYLQELLGLFDLYVRYDMGISNYSSVFMIKDPISEAGDGILQVFDFFKPYQARLIEYATYLLINDAPGNYFLLDDNIFLVIKQTIEDIWSQLQDGEIYFKIYQTITDRIGFEDFDPTNRYLFDLIWFDITMLTVNQYVKDVFIDNTNEVVKINMSKLLYTSMIWNIDKLNILIKHTINDRINFNDNNAYYDFTVFDVSYFRNKNKYFDDYTSLYRDELIINENIL